MFSSFLHEKNQANSSLLQQNEAKSLRIFKKQQKTREKLLTKYKTRVTSHILDLSLNPVSVFSKPRTNSERLASEKLFRMKPKDSKDRIQDALKNNSILDLQPLALMKYQPRPRRKELEIQSDMKFTPKDRFERVAEAQNQNKDLAYPYQTGRDPSLRHGKKLCFKTLEEIALNADRKKNQRSGMSFLFQRDAEHEQDGLLDLGSVALDVLEKCRLRPTRREGLHRSNGEF